jgi:NAD(P)-dependent dehydrogenase (short-subunit alcohol dehydrogenase family)
LYVSRSKTVQVVQKTVDEYGRIDVLVNNAAFQGTNIKDISELTRERVERTFKVI